HRVPRSHRPIGKVENEFRSNRSCTAVKATELPARMADHNWVARNTRTSSEFTPNVVANAVTCKVPAPNSQGSGPEIEGSSGPPHVESALASSLLPVIRSNKTE